MPAISTVIGQPGGALLKVNRPTTISNEDVVSYLIQAYADNAGTQGAAVGKEVKGVNTKTGATGEAGNELEFVYPYPMPAKLWFVVTMDAGTTRSNPSTPIGPITVGEPASTACPG